MPIHKVEGGYQWGGRGKVYATRAEAARQARAAYANGYVGKSLSEIRKGLSQDDKKALAAGVGGTATAAGLGGTAAFIVRGKGHGKLLKEQIDTDRHFAGTKTTPVNHYLRGEGAGKIVPEQQIMRHLKRGKLASIGLAGGGAALTAHGLRRKPVEKADHDRRRTAEVAAMGGGATLAGGGYGLARVLEGQGNKWAKRSAETIDEAKKIAPQLGGWTEGKSNSRVRYVKPDIPSKNVSKNPELLRRMSRKKIERVAELRGAAGQHGHFAKIYGDIARQSRRYAVPAGVAVGAAGAGSMALRNRRDHLAKAMTKDEKKKATATGVGAVGIGAGLVGGGLPGIKADASASERLFPHLPKYQKPKPKDLLAPGPVRPRVKAAAQMGRGGIFGYRTDAHDRFLRQQQNDAKFYGNTQTTRGNHFLRGQGAGKMRPEQKIIRHMKAGRRASYGLLAGGAGLTAYGTHKKKPVQKADDKDRRNAALVAGGGTVAGGSYGAARLLEHQGRRWAKQSARDIEAAQKIAPGLGGWTEGSRKNKRVPNIKPDVSNKQAEVRRRNIFAGHTRAQAQRAGELRGSAAQGRYFSGVYGVNARRIRRIGIPAGAAVAAAGAGGLALNKRKEVGKAYQPGYFQGSAPTERLQGQRQRTSTEAQRAALQAGGVGLAGGSAAALGARLLGNDAAPAAVRAAGAVARRHGVPKETVKDLTHRADKVHTWARNKRGRLLAAGAAAAAGAGAARIGARWKKSEVEGISQDLGRASSGDRLQYGSRRVTKGIGTALVGSYGMKAARKWADLDPKTRNRIVRGTLVGTTATGTAAGTGWTVNRQARWHNEKKKLKEAGGITGPVMKTEPVGKGTNVRQYGYLPENIREDVGYGSIGVRRNPMSALDLFASSRIMAQAQARASGDRISRRRLTRRAYNEMNYAGGRAMLYSPVGRGSVF